MAGDFRPFEYYSNRELKRVIDELVGMHDRAAPEEREPFKPLAAVLREEAMLRLHGPGGGHGLAGVREPRRPGPSSDAGAVAVNPHDA